MTFVASTGDYGAADPEYPAFSPNVVAVGGTSLTLNADGSYNSETGWGYNSAAMGTFIGSGGGISLYEPEPAYQQSVQSTGGRTTPDVSLVADPATGAWIADPYNLNPSNPFEIVGGTSLSAPAWAGLLALVNQGRAAAGESTLDSSSPTQTQQALYILPQSDYNVIASGNNGYTAESGYNLVTGLGTPVANLLVPNLVSYQGPRNVLPWPERGSSPGYDPCRPHGRRECADRRLQRVRFPHRGEQWNRTRTGHAGFWDRRLHETCRCFCSDRRSRDYEPGTDGAGQCDQQLDGGQQPRDEANHSSTDCGHGLARPRKKECSAGDEHRHEESGSRGRDGRRPGRGGL